MFQRNGEGDNYGVKLWCKVTRATALSFPVCLCVQGELFDGPEALAQGHVFGTGGTVAEVGLMTTILFCGNHPTPPKPITAMKLNPEWNTVFPFLTQRAIFASLEVCPRDNTFRTGMRATQGGISGQKGRVMCPGPQSPRPVHLQPLAPS